MQLPALRFWHVSEDVHTARCRHHPKQDEAEWTKPPMQSEEQDICDGTCGTSPGRLLGTALRLDLCQIMRQGAVRKSKWHLPKIAPLWLLRQPAIWPSC